MIWEAIAKRRLVRRGEDEVAAIARRMSGEDPSIRTVAPPGTPEELLAICDKSMSHSPDDRHATALDLHDALDRYLRKTSGADQKRVAEFLETAYGVDRKRARAFVEEQLRNADDSSPLVDVSKASIRTVAEATVADVESGRGNAHAALGDARLAPTTGPSAGTSAPQVADVTPLSRGAAPAAAIPAVALIAFVAIALGLATLGVVLMLAARGGSKSAGAVGPPATASVSAPSDPAAATASTVRLAVHAEAATLSIDDEPQALPYQGRLARGASVRVAARAPGFVDYDRVLTLDEDTNLDIALSRAPLAAGSSSSSPAVTSVRTGAADDRAKARKKRAIDDGDPYRR
jgi:hypothetical protein